MNYWVDFLKELELAAVEPSIIIQSFSEGKSEVFYQEELELDDEIM